MFSTQILPHISSGQSVTQSLRSLVKKFRSETFTEYLHLLKEVLYQASDPFTTRICAGILMLFGFCSCSVAFLQKIVRMSYFQQRALF